MAKNRANDHSKYANWIDPQDVRPYERNVKQHTDKQIRNIVNSIKRFGWQQDTVITADKVLVIGHGRRLAALQLGCMMPYHMIDKTADELTDDDIRELRIADNQTNAETGYDFDIMGIEVKDLDFEGFDFDFGLDDGTNVKETVESAGSLTERFMIPPFSVLDTRQGRWQDRKKAWKVRIGDRGQARDVAPFSGIEKLDGGNYTDASILDPVLSELACRWFMPDKGQAFDVFAGDTVFGYVSSYLGNKFTGIELREEQCAFNRAACAGLDATYICDDGRNVLQHIGEKTQDLLFSCPPYFDLEQYSDLPNDASNQDTYEDFYAILDTAFTNAIRCLRDNRFAVIVVGDIRDKKTSGYMRFPDDIKDTFIRNGMVLLNELILIDPVGTAR